MKNKRLRPNRYAVVSITILVSILLLVSAPQMVKADYYEGDYSYTVTSGQATLTGYYNYGEDLVVPSTLGGYPVVAIGDYATFQDSLMTITIPNTVTSIGEGAFMACLGLETVNIPSSVTSIGNYAFYHCIELTAINVDATNPNYKSIQGVLFNKEGTTLIQYTVGNWDVASYVIPNTVTTIGVGAFSECNFHLTSVTIPSSVTSIGDKAFSGSYFLTSPTIPDSVTSIGNEAFYGCHSFTSITIPKSVTSIGDSAFSGCDSLTSITFHGLTPPTIGTNWIVNTNPTLLGHAYYVSSFPAPGSLFNGLTMGNYIPEDYYYKITNGQATITSYGYHGALGDVTIPSTLGGCPVTAIGSGAFFQYSGLTSITIPDSVTSIGNSAFYGCSGLTSLTIPDSVTSIGDRAFSRCLSLASVNLGSVTSIGDYAFYMCLLSSVTIPDSVTSIGKYAFYDCSSLTSVNIGSGVISIGNVAFAGCPSLTAIDVAAANPNYKSIQGVLFDKQGTTLIEYPDGKSDTSYTVPNTVTTIGKDAFVGSSLTSVTLGSSVTSIGDYAFYECLLSSVTIPDSVTSIGKYAFDACTYLTSVTLGNGVISIDQAAFADCSSLTSVTLGSSVINIGVGAFVDCSSLTSITLPDSVISIAYGAFWGCSGLTSVTLGSSVTSIGEYAFYHCYSLSSITIPNGVVSIGDSAFTGSSLTSMTIPASVTSIGEAAFWGCSSLTSITFLGLTPPTTGTSWIGNTNPTLLGHAYYGSSFPAPGSLFNTLMMGDYLPDTASPTITSVSPPSSITLSTQGTSASQAFSASYTDNVAVASATVTLDGNDVSSTWGVSTSGFSYTAALPIGSRTIVLTVNDIADSQGIQRTSTQTWIVNVLDAGVPVISNISPSSSLTLYTQGRTATQTFTASYTDNLAITSATVTLDGESVTSTWGVTTSGFSYSASLTVGSHTIILTVSDAAGNKATQTWSVTVVKDTKAPSISGIADQKITYGTSIVVVITDSQSDVNWDSLKVTMDNQDIPTSVRTANGFTLTSTVLTTGAHTVTITVSDNIGNTAKLTCDIIVK